jgi:hypothetical protein
MSLLLSLLAIDKLFLLVKDQTLPAVLGFGTRIHFSGTPKTGFPLMDVCLIAMRVRECERTQRMLHQWID